MKSEQNKIVLQWPPPESWPNRSTGRHWSIAHAARKHQRRLAYLIARSTGFKLKENDAVRIEFKPPAQVSRFDLDNALAACKGYIDGLCDASGVDDSKLSYQLVKGGKIADGEVVMSRDR